MVEGVSACDYVRHVGNAGAAGVAAWVTGSPGGGESAKYVVSSTLQEATWQNSTIAGPYSADAIRQVKDVAT